MVCLYGYIHHQIVNKPISFPSWKLPDRIPNFCYNCGEFNLQFYFFWFCSYMSSWSLLLLCLLCALLMTADSWRIENETLQSSILVSRILFAILDCSLLHGFTFLCCLLVGKYFHLGYWTKCCTDVLTDPPIKCVTFLF